MPRKAPAPSFDDLDDASLDAPPPKAPETFLEFSARLATTHGKQLYKCERCQGRGTVAFRNGAAGKCYRCDGSGQQKRKPLDRSPDAIARRTKQAAKREESRRNELQQQALWREAHADVIEWVRTRDGRNDFATSLSNSLGQYGTLTENQVAAVRRSIANAAATARAAALQTARPATSGLDLSSLPEGRYAVPGGDTRLKILVKKPAAPSKWAGWVFVSDAAEYGARKTYGRQKPGYPYAGQIQPELTAILADPKAASAAYGRLTSHCGVCGRPLEDSESVARGIGPICFARFG